MRSSLYARGILFIAFVCLALLGLDFEQGWTAHDVRLQQAQTETDNLARSLAQHAQDVFETTNAVIEGLSETIRTDGRESEAILRLDRRMHVQVERQRLLHGIAIFDEHGDWLATSLADPAFEKVHGLNYAGLRFFRYHRDNPDNVALIGPPIQSKSDGAWVVTLTRRLNYPDGTFGGVVEAAIAIDLFQQFFETFDIGKQGAITLTDGEGEIIVRRPFDKNNVGLNIAQSQFFRTIPPHDSTGSARFTSLIGGKPRIGSFRRVRGFDLVMIVALDQNEVLAAWRHEMKIHLVWSSITIVFILFLGYRLNLQIRDRVVAETVAHTLRLEADQRGRIETERQTYQRVLEQQKRELERSNAALEQFAYAASHDLQSPLRGIAHLAQWIGEDVSATASQETMENLKLLNGRVTRLQMLTHALLAYARVGRGDPVAEAVSLAAVVQDVVDLLDQRPNFVIACEGEMPALLADRVPLQSVLKNLIANALQHHDRTEGHVGVSMRLTNGMAEIRVGDDGPGIDKRFHDAIFVIFRTLQSHEQTELSGIGLAVVKKLVTENGGQIWLESAPPARGCTFVFTWKLATLDTQQGKLQYSS